MTGRLAARRVVGDASYDVITGPSCEWAARHAPERDCAQLIWSVSPNRFQPRAEVAVAWVMALVFCAWASVASSAPAEEVATNSATDQLQEVVVTATKRTENIQTVPVAITALSGEALKDAQVHTVQDLQSSVPSLVIQQAFDDPQDVTVMLRGRKQNDTTLAVDPAVGVYADGIYIPRTQGLAGELLDINRIEVLRGPQGSLYGRNTTGGALTIYTNDPTDKLSGSLDVTGGNFRTWDVVGIANVPIVDNVAARFVMQRGGNGPYGFDGAGRPLENNGHQYYRGKLRAQFSENWTAVLAAHYESETTGGQIVKLIGLCPAAAPACGGGEGGGATLETAAETGLSVPDAATYLQSLIARGRGDFWNNFDNGPVRPFSTVWRADSSLNITGSLSESIEFRSLTGYSHLHHNGNAISNGVPVTLIDAKVLANDNYYSQEFQLLNTGSSRFKWIVGTYGGYERGDRDYNEFVALPALLGTDPAINDNKILNSSLAGFAQLTWEFMPAWRLTLGGRYSADTRRVDAISSQAGVCLVPAPGVDSLSVPGSAAQCPRRFQATFKKPTATASIDYQLTPDILLYSKVADGYRSGGINESGAVSAQSFAPFKPETNIEYEGGIKSEFLDHRLRVNFDGYYDKYTDLQVTTGFIDPAGGVGTAVTNAASARIWGLEAEAEFLVAPGLRLHASGAHTDAHYLTFVDQILGDRSREPFSVPKWTGTLSASFTKATGLGDLQLNIDYDWTSTFVLDGAAIVPAQVTQPSYGLLNARLTLHAAQDLDISFFGKNMTNKGYYQQAIALDSALGANYGYAGLPRTYGIELVKNWGAASH
jgi:iron complex outermembrane recepter protein